MFIEPSEKNSPMFIHPENIIEDPELREMWTKNFGENCFWVDIENFKKVFLEEMKKQKRIKPELLETEEKQTKKQ